MGQIKFFKAASVGAIATAMAMPGVATTTASAQEERVGGVTILSDCNGSCRMPVFSSEEEYINYMENNFGRMNDGDRGNAPVGAGGSAEGANGPSGLGLGLGLGINGPQIVVLDFETGDPTFTGTVEGVTLTLPDHIYTESEKQAIKSRLEADYAPYNFTFTFDQPAEGDFLLLQFNSNDNPGTRRNSTPGILRRGILFGVASELDFGNDSRAALAQVDVNFYTFLNGLDAALGDPIGTRLENVSGIDIDLDGNGPDTGVSVSEALSTVIVNASANIGAHELGHTLGLRHHDAFGPIGSGINPEGIPTPGTFVSLIDTPVLTEADETFLHIMSGGATGRPLSGSANADNFLSERSAIKMAINERGRFITDEEINREGFDPFKRLKVVNPILEGDNADGRFDVRNVLVEGTIDELGDFDFFEFNGKAGDVLNVEAISDVEGQFNPDFDLFYPSLSLFFFDEATQTFQQIAQNIQGYESFDAFLIDFVLPEDGLYVVFIEASEAIFLDFNGDGTPEIQFDLARLSDQRERELRTGQYILNAYIVEPKNGNGPQKIGGPSK